ncbi:FtsW/RodA/SpoVE family cell cycle protein [Candidatus Nomurabacteria bacterium]|nr:FtsW/RodA/SpoVE family cell cycle protein [Candidatus Nomurabacteria bacterium]
MPKKGKNIFQKKTEAGKPDLTILIFTVSMIIFGIIMVFDSSVFVANQPPFNDPYHFLRLHFVWVLIGIIPSVLIYLWDYRKFSKLIIPAMVINILMLILVLFSGNAVNGSHRWLRFGSDQLVLQPAEFIKPIFIVYIATWLAKERPYYKNFKDALKLGFGQKLIGFSLTLGLVLLLIVLEPDLGTTLVIGATAFAVFLVSGTDFAHLLGSAFVTGVFGLMAGIAAILAPYRLKRVQTYIHLFFTGQVDDPQGRGYQIQQILIGIGSGGFWGKGFGQSRQRSGYLVELTAFTDSIFAVST